MKTTMSIYNFNHIDPNIPKSEVAELKALCKYYHKKILALQNDLQIFEKNDLACTIGEGCLIVSGSIPGLITLNPIVL